MRVAIGFTNFGPYHLARLRALAERLREQGDELVAYETAGHERKYPWAAGEAPPSMVRRTLFPDVDLESLSSSSCRLAMLEALDEDRPDALLAVGYVRPEVLAMSSWARRHRVPIVLLSESQRIDARRVFWKEAVKSHRVRRFDAALVGGERHRDYLIELGMPAERIELGYNAVDHDRYAAQARSLRADAASHVGLPVRAYFLAVCRFVPEKNLNRLVRAFAAYRRQAGGDAWDLVLCGGGPLDFEIEAAVREAGAADAVHRPGFLQADELCRWYAHAGAFVHPSLVEPWGLVVNEAAACALPLLVSERCGCAPTLVPDPSGTTGERFDPMDEAGLSAAMLRIAGLSETTRMEMGRRAERIAAQWGPRRFAQGAVRAIELAREAARFRATLAR